MPIDAITNAIVSGGVEEQARQVLKNLSEVIKAGGSDFSKVVKTTVRVVLQSYLAPQCPRAL